MNRTIVIIGSMGIVIGFIVCILAMVITIGPNEAQSIRTIDGSVKYNYVVITYCSDKVICYFVGEGHGNAMHCFRDADLINKYCD